MTWALTRYWNISLICRKAVVKDKTIWMPKWCTVAAQKCSTLSKLFVNDKFFGGTLKSIVFKQVFEQWNQWLELIVCWLCTDRLQPSEPRQQSLARPDLAQPGLSLQATSPVPVCGAGGDTRATAVGAWAPVWGPLDAVGDWAKRWAGQATPVVLTCLLCWKEVQEEENICCVHRAESCLKWTALMKAHESETSAHLSLTYCKLLLGSGEMSKNSAHRCFAHMWPSWHLFGIELCLFCHNSKGTRIHSGLCPCVRTLAELNLTAAFTGTAHLKIKTTVYIFFYIKSIFLIPLMPNRK